MQNLVRIKAWFSFSFIYLKNTHTHSTFDNSLNVLEWYRVIFKTQNDTHTVTVKLIHYTWMYFWDHVLQYLTSNNSNKTIFTVVQSKQGGGGGVGGVHLWGAVALWQEGKGSKGVESRLLHPFCCNILFSSFCYVSCMSVPYIVHFV